MKSLLTQVLHKLRQQFTELSGGSLGLMLYKLSLAATELLLLILATGYQLVLVLLLVVPMLLVELMLTLLMALGQLPKLLMKIPMSLRQAVLRIKLKLAVVHHALHLLHQRVIGMSRAFLKFVATLRR